MTYKLNGIVFDINQEHLIGDVNYPRNWFHDPNNREAMGITEEVDPIPPGYAPTIEEIKASLIRAIQSHLDAKAQERGYDNIFTACTYVGDINPAWAAEGQAYKIWRSSVWQHCLQVMADVQDGLRAIPAEAQLIAELPILVL